MGYFFIKPDYTSSMIFWGKNLSYISNTLILPHCSKNNHRYLNLDVDETKFSLNFQQIACYLFCLTFHVSRRTVSAIISNPRVPVPIVFSENINNYQNQNNYRNTRNHQYQQQLSATTINNKISVYISSSLHQHFNFT